VKSVVVLAAASGGQSSVVLDACLAAGTPLAGEISIGAAARIRGSDLSILGDERLLEDAEFLAQYAIALGGGEAHDRRRLAGKILSLGGSLATVVHPSSAIARSAALGVGTTIAAHAVVGPNARLGRFCIINTCASVDHDDVLEDGVNLSPGVHLAGGVTCLEDAFMGIGAVAAPGVRIGRRAIVGAGSTVIRDVPDDVTVIGTPARAIRSGTEGAHR
jgi:sugar O-acyltransferase (sialic acid O-acetyltransferase NeuD family)